MRINTAPILFILLSFLAAIIFAQSIVSITSPLSGTRYQAGTTVIISWINPTVPKISQIVLARGKPTALQPVLVLAKDVDAASGKYAWSIPPKIGNGDDYALELGTSPDLAFTGQFSIEGGVA